MRSLISALALVSLACATHPELGGGPPRSQAVQQASHALMCAEESLQTQVLEGFLLVTGCGSTAAFSIVGDAWSLRLQYRTGGWIFSRALLKEDVAVFAKATEDLGCEPHEVTLQRELGVRVARGCGFKRAYTVVCGEEIHELELEQLPTHAAARATPVPTDREAAAAAPRAQPFGGGMTRPKKLCGREPRFTDVSLKTHATGLAVVKCILTEEGYVDACQVLKPLEHHTEVLIDALYSQRFGPATFEGKPVRVDYVFNMRAILP